MHEFSHCRRRLQQWISLISCPQARDRGTNQWKQLVLLCVLSMNTCSVLVRQFMHKLPSQPRAEVFRGQWVCTQHKKHHSYLTWVQTWTDIVVNTQCVLKQCLQFVSHSIQLQTRKLNKLCFIQNFRGLIHFLSWNSCMDLPCSVLFKLPYLKFTGAG